ncbi:MAG: hypothetical protein WD691_11395 [Acidimicrobiales bacterium]
MIVVTLVSALAATGAFAAGLTTTSDTLASGTTAVARCDATPAWIYTFAKNASEEVIAVTVSDIDAGCAGGALSLALEPIGATGGPVTISSCSVTCDATVPLSTSALPDQATSVAAIIEGP